jgi:hypothetical protein
MQISVADIHYLQQLTHLDFWTYNFREDFLYSFSQSKTRLAHGGPVFTIE